MSDLRIQKWKALNSRKLNDNQICLQVAQLCCNAVKQNKSQKTVDTQTEGEAVPIFR